jgi:hypothetical protein
MSLWYIKKFRKYLRKKEGKCEDIQKNEGKSSNRVEFCGGG